ncbi:MAG: DNA primase, partial [Chloroflexi bacterium]|nr:DNA primase [Chloroflexota bacterium]
MSVVDDIKARLDIVDTVSGYVTLQKAGRNFKAVCPFHTEKTPSFIVNPERQSWRCFGACATGGDAFSFVMRKENLDFRGALELLARKTGVTLTTKSDNDRSEALYGINKVAARFYQDVLKSAEGKHGMKYLEGRGVNRESIAKFELGMSPEGWDGLKSHLLMKGFSENVAVEAGLVRRNEEQDSSWDFFRGRLMFPIHNRYGQVAGFGAR